MNAAVEYQKKRSAEAKAKVMSFMSANPLSNAKECSESLGMKYGTVAMYIRDAKREKVKK